MPTCCDETSEAETAAATPRGKKKKRARCTRNYSDDNATLRMHPKRTDEASEFQKPLLTEIHCGESRSRFFIPLFFVTFSLSPPLLPRSYAHAPASRFFQSGNALTRMYAPCEHIACSTEWRNGHKREEMEVHRKVVCCFYSCSVKSKWIPLRPPNVFSERICKERWDFSGGTKSDIIRDETLRYFYVI